MILFPNAKINLGLQIVAKRSDGYHNLQTGMYPIGWQDVLEVVEADPKKQRKGSFVLSGMEIPGAEKDNLVLRAYELLRKDYDLPPVAVQLHKLIPTGAGLGGGSADAAFMLKAVNELFQLFLDESILEDYAGRLGSDCPFFIRNSPAIALERGDVLAPLSLDLSAYHLVVVKPPVHVATAEAYAGVRPKTPDQPLNEILNLPVDDWKGRLHNDFEDSIFPKYPQIAELKERLYAAGALYASMSGSGAAVYGLFTEAPADLHFPQEYQHWQGRG
ncbi:4-(cytidine 5'-diphospho)-2-C-methyl-D-erythritol kinase [Cesiribacter andamanensis]|uniref:4-diphosphocytidyl-2-C-methyl-D-erythritol kinase n=1 Tax=Cesiribacter andamanensis AMV16 TaxID=1279009 RepID=M7N7B6_9BACT|nr:4-(cytidine 5'-diphospho)-2-C-methyl-D-erythritol kinase [Cesiribacter andamanensis]EMR03157.1 4-diphosphocytidyl-2-C-methyl-D-erythritol kinase [Cesiribacter andamanensis AMV16]